MRTEIPDIIRLLLMIFNTVVIMYCVGRIIESLQSRRSSNKLQRPVIAKTRLQQTSTASNSSRPGHKSSAQRSAKQPIKEITFNKKVSAKSGRSTDLTRIQGVGPKSEQILKRAGIKSFTDLSKQTPESINKILVEYDVRYGMYDVTSWPKQAKLAAAGEWRQLQQLKKRL